MSNDTSDLDRAIVEWRRSRMELSRLPKDSHPHRAVVKNRLHKLNAKLAKIPQSQAYPELLDWQEYRKALASCRKCAHDAPWDQLCPDCQLNFRQLAAAADRLMKLGLRLTTSNSNPNSPAAT